MADSKLVQELETLLSKKSKESFDYRANFVAGMLDYLRHNDRDTKKRLNDFRLGIFTPIKKEHEAGRTCSEKIHKKYGVAAIYLFIDLLWNGVQQD